MLAAFSDYDAITKTVQHYIKGCKTGRTAEMKLAFHPDATIFGYIGLDLFADPIQELFDWNDKNGPATELQGRITSIDLFETVATVRLELDNWTGHRFTDFFTLTVDSRRRDDLHYSRSSLATFARPHSGHRGCAARRAATIRL